MKELLTSDLRAAKRFLQARREQFEAPTALDVRFMVEAWQREKAQPRCDATIAQLPPGGAALSTDQVPIFRNGQTYAVQAGTIGSIASSSYTGIYNIHDYGALPSVTDNTAYIQAAHDAAYAAGGGVVFVPNGTYNVATRSNLVALVYTCLTLKSNVVFVGQSRAGAVIRLANGVQSCIIGANNCSDAGVHNLTLDGNRINQTESGQDGNQCGLFTYQAQRLTVSSLSTINCQRQGFYDSLDSYTRLDDFYAFNCGCEGFSLSNSYYGKYDNIQTISCGQNAASQGSYHSGVYVNGGSLENVVTNIFTQNNVGFGFSMVSDTGSTDCVNNQFVGITSLSNVGGVYIGSTGASTFVSRNKFSNLVSRLDGTGPAQDAVTLYQANDNLFDGCLVYNAQKGAGLRLISSNNNRFDGFETYDDQGVHTQTYGILESANCAENIFNNPIFRGGFTAGAYSLTTSVVQGAVGALNFLRPRTPALLNAWVAFAGGTATPTVERDGNNLIRLHGMIKSGTLNSPAFTLNAGERPAFDMYLAAYSNGAFGVLFIGANGNVTPVSGSNVSFSLEGVPVYSGN